MENKDGKQKGKEKEDSLSTKQIRIAGVFYGTRALAECMEEVIKLHMEK